ncbi:hypothetical protein [uncultured Proteiniphilum sp.]|uniref:hypothetical protein n=1 Tax=uncultured Proteiniphilum sp. TaxID=497637 RepID=UPI002605C885|nr:hypothetical protein [uncultured Proteiniphilum sp.]
MEENKPIELRSEKVRNIIGRMPPVLVRYGTVMIVAALLVLAGIAAFVPYQPKISIEITAMQDEGGKVHYIAWIPQRAMLQRGKIAFIAGHPPVEGPMPVRFVFHDVPDTLHVSRSGGWYEVEVYPVDHDGQAIKIPAPFTFPAKIELRYTTFWKWVARN